jgi:DNA-binding transcriptional LysR family regulator
LEPIVDKLDAMNAFAKVVALGSYAEAGRHLGLTRSAVSKAVMELEQVLGVRLLDRTTRRVSRLLKYQPARRHFSSTG